MRRAALVLAAALPLLLVACEPRPTPARTSTPRAAATTVVAAIPDFRSTAVPTGMDPVLPAHPVTSTLRVASPPSASAPIDVPIENVAVADLTSGAVRDLGPGFVPGFVDSQFAYWLPPFDPKTDRVEQQVDLYSGVVSRRMRPASPIAPPTGLPPAQPTNPPIYVVGRSVLDGAKRQLFELPENAQVHRGGLFTSIEAGTLSLWEWDSGLQRPRHLVTMPAPASERGRPWPALAVSRDGDWLLVDLRCSAHTFTRLFNQRDDLLVEVVGPVGSGGWELRPNGRALFGAGYPSYRVQYIYNLRSESYETVLPTWVSGANDVSPDLRWAIYGPGSRRNLCGDD